MATDLVFVKSPHFKLYDGQPLELGEVFQMRSQPNDAKLIGLGYVEIIKSSKKHPFVPDKCDGCGREFANDSYRRAHQRKTPHEAVDISGPNLKPRKREKRLDMDPDSGADWDLEPEGSPPPSPSVAGLAADRGYVSTRGDRRGGRRADEVIRLGR